MFKTQLLAYNTSIEANRLGSSGKRFKTISLEIAQLADSISGILKNNNSINSKFNDLIGNVSEKISSTNKKYSDYFSMVNEYTDDCEKKLQNQSKENTLASEKIDEFNSKLHKSFASINQTQETKKVSEHDKDIKIDPNEHSKNNKLTKNENNSLEENKNPNINKGKKSLRSSHAFKNLKRKLKNNGK